MSTKAKRSDNVSAAENILRGQSASAGEIYDLAKRLKDKEQEFGYARRLLALARTDPKVNEDTAFRTLLRQQHALCTYKDPDLPDNLKFNRAIQILGDGDDLAKTVDQETLGIAGAIYKYRWQTFARRQDLESALHYYMRGYQQGVRSDYGYTGINAAFVLDLLAEEEHVPQVATADDACGRIATARKIRQDIIDASADLLRDHPWLEQKWWFAVTLVEAYFGLEDYKEARRWLEAASKLTVEKWEYETTAKQLATLARLLMRHAGKPMNIAQWMDSPAWTLLKDFPGSSASGVWSAFIGKVGVALSGGGFRASFFHIGVLAKLAELDVLRHVEVLSCVSGGSIVGAHYYLKVRKLLQSTRQDAISRESFITLVRDLEKEFFAGVEKNIRTRVIGSFGSNLKMAFLSDYSRTERVGELYEKHLFQQVEPDTKEFWLNDLMITPIDAGADFHPKYHNWQRNVKVPVLVLNATTLNTGHNWQFTASWMGEPPAGAEADVDANYRLRRMYYSEAPRGYQKVRLGAAVAASACVPGIFEPLNFPNLYPDITVRLVDGGVHDNQGTSALLDQRCSVLFVSDASGQMGEEDEPAGGPISVLLRANSILQARIRVAEYDDVEARRRSSLLKGLMFVHLKKDLDAESKDWTDCEDPIEASDEARPRSQNGVLTPYGIRKDIQRKLSAIRTDLDSFNEAEAFALMVSGYRMTEEQFTRSFPDLPRQDPPADWRFLAVEPVMKRIGGNEEAFRKLETLLDVARAGAFKIWKMEAVLKVVAVVLLLAAAAGLLYMSYLWRAKAVITYGGLGGFLLSIVISIGLAKVLGPRIAHFIAQFGSQKRIQTEIWRVIAFVLIGVFGFVLAWIHIGIFDRWYKSKGRLFRIIGSPPDPGKNP